jgi:hypothetical protein
MAAHPYIEAGGVVVRQGVEVRVEVIEPREAWFFVQVRTRARAPSMVRSIDWAAPLGPPLAHVLWGLPLIDASSRGDATAASALPTLAPEWSALERERPRVIVASDGEAIVAWIDEPSGPQVVESTIGAVVAMATLARSHAIS